jgi:hypothetical protein
LWQQYNAAKAECQLQHERLLQLQRQYADLEQKVYEYAECAQVAGR